MASYDVKFGSTVYNVGDLIIAKTVAINILKKVFNTKLFAEYRDGDVITIFDASDESKLVLIIAKDS